MRRRILYSILAVTCALSLGACGKAEKQEVTDYHPRSADSINEANSTADSVAEAGISGASSTAEGANESTPAFTDNDEDGPIVPESQGSSVSSDKISDPLPISDDIVKRINTPQKPVGDDAYPDSDPGNLPLYFEGAVQTSFDSVTFAEMQSYGYAIDTSKPSTPVEATKFGYLYMKKGTTEIAFIVLNRKNTSAAPQDCLIVGCSIGTNSGDESLGDGTTRLYIGGKIDAYQHNVGEPSQTADIANGKRYSWSTDDRELDVDTDANGTITALSFIQVPV